MADIEQLKNWMDWNRAQKPADEEDVENDLCPYCDWTLDINKDGKKSCAICGRIWLGSKQILSRK